MSVETGRERTRVRGWLLAATVVLLGYTLFRASRRTLWHDELYTFHLASLPTFADTWRSIASGMEQLPPFSYLLVRPCLGLTGRAEVDLRLVPAFSFAVAAWALFLLARRRMPSLYAAGAAALLLVTPAYATYATEARPYALVCALSALALLAWEHTAGPRRPFALAALLVVLLAATATHYYAVFLLVPLAAGELARAWRRGRPDVPVAAVLLLSVAPLAPVLPGLARSARSGYLAHFWARAHLTDAPSTYVSFFSLVALALVPLVVVTLRRVMTGSAGQPSAESLPPDERAMLLAGAALPVVIVVIARFTTHVFTARYASAAIAPVCVLVAWGAVRVARGTRAGAWLLLGGTALVFLGQEREFLRNNHGPVPVVTPALAADGANAGLPILVLDAHRFLETFHYAEPSLRERLVFAVDLDGAVAETGTDTADRAFLDLRRTVPVRVVEHERLVADDTRLLIWGLRPTHTVRRLRKEGWRVELLGFEGGEPLLRASRP